MFLAALIVRAKKWKQPKVQPQKNGQTKYGVAWYIQYNGMSFSDKKE